MPDTSEHTYLGFDYGEKRIGIAVGQTITGTASPLTTIACHNRQPDWEQVAKLLDEWKPHALVVGLPKHMNGDEHEMTKAAQKFGNRLHGRFGLPVHYEDERLSSAKAETILTTQRQQGTKKRTQKSDIDKLAAALLLQSWLDHSRV